MRNRSGKRFAPLMAPLAAVLLAACGGDTRVESGQVVPALSPDTLALWMDEGRPLLLYDVRDRDAYDQRHLPGAAPAEARTISELRETLSPDPDVPLVFYSQDGTVDPVRHDAAAEAVERYRFPRVYWLEGGLEAWASHGYTLDGHAVLGGD